MNKQEAIERIESRAFNIGDTDLVVGLRYTKNIINQINEPQKVTIPKFVAEWIKFCKASDIKLLGALDPNAKPWEVLMEALVNSFDGNVGDCITWATRNQDTFARAWLDGYLKEQLYTVEIADAILTKITRGRNVQYKMLPSKDVSDVFDKGIYATGLTETEIKQKDERLWQFAKPVEEN